MNRRYLVSKILLFDGVLLIVIAFIHLFATPLVNKWLSRELTATTLENISPPFLLNHIVVGILLIPFGVSTLFSAIGVRGGQAWARGIAFTNAIAVLIFPLLIAWLMGKQYFTAPLFLVTTIIITLIGVSMVLPLIWLGKGSTFENHSHAHHHI
jgi:hypothetical protein